MGWWCPLHTPFFIAYWSLAIWHKSLVWLFHSWYGEFTSTSLKLISVITLLSFLLLFILHMCLNRPNLFLIIDCIMFSFTISFFHTSMFNQSINQSINQMLTSECHIMAMPLLGTWQNICSQKKRSLCRVWLTKQFSFETAMEDT